MSVTEQKGRKVSGLLFIAAGCMFFLAAAIGRQVVFGGVGAAFVAIGASYLAMAKSDRQ